MIRRLVETFFGNTVKRGNFKREILALDDTSGRNAKGIKFWPKRRRCLLFPCFFYFLNFSGFFYGRPIVSAVSLYHWLAASFFELAGPTLLRSDRGRFRSQISGGKIEWRETFTTLALNWFSPVTYFRPRAKIFDAPGRRTLGPKVCSFCADVVHVGAVGRKSILGNCVTLWGII